MADLTLTQLNEKFVSLTTKMDSIITRINTMQSDINSRVRLSDLSTSEEELKDLMNDQGEIITDLERKLAKISLPEATRYYLTEQEISAFKTDFTKLKAMLAKSETLYKNLVAFSVSRASS